MDLKELLSLLEDYAKREERFWAASKKTIDSSSLQKALENALLAGLNGFEAPVIPSEHLGKSPVNMFRCLELVQTTVTALNVHSCMLRRMLSAVTSFNIAIAPAFPPTPASCIGF
jgi:hypothetical protein